MIQRGIRDIVEHFEYRRFWITSLLGWLKKPPKPFYGDLDTACESGFLYPNYDGNTLILLNEFNLVEDPLVFRSEDSMLHILHFEPGVNYEAFLVRRRMAAEYANPPP